MRSRIVLSVGPILLPAIVLVTACGKSGPPAWTPDVSRVVGKDPPLADSIRLDVYVDGTVSMGGYAVPDGNYGRFLYGLESASQTAWKRADIHYFKFGASVREIPRQDFLDARSQSFYHEPGLSAETSIQKAIECRRGQNLQVIITDLFQTEGDINTVVDQVKRQCFQQGVTAGILGIPSQFDGTVYDARVPAYHYASGSAPASLRPFFALMFGERAAIDRLVEVLSTLPFVDTTKFTSIGPTIVSRYSVDMSKPRSNQAINLRQRRGPYQFVLDVRSGMTGGVLVDTVRLRPRPGAMPIRADQVELAGFRKTPRTSGHRGWTDSTPTRDFTLTRFALNGETGVATLNANVSGPPGQYAYMLVLRTGAINGFDVPAWVRALSSDDPTPSSDANRTMNLDRFVLALRGAASSVIQPEIAQWYVDVRKQ